MRSGAIFLAALQDPRLRRKLVDICTALADVNVESLAKDFTKIVEPSPVCSVGIVPRSTRRATGAGPGIVGGSSNGASNMEATARKLCAASSRRPTRPPMT